MPAGMPSRTDASVGAHRDAHSGLPLPAVPPGEAAQQPPLPPAPLPPRSARGGSSGAVRVDRVLRACLDASRCRDGLPWPPASGSCRRRPHGRSLPLQLTRCWRPIRCAVGLWVGGPVAAAADAVVHSWFDDTVGPTRMAPGPEGSVGRLCRGGGGRGVPWRSGRRHRPRRRPSVAGAGRGRRRRGCGGRGGGGGEAAGAANFCRQRCGWGG